MKTRARAARPGVALVVGLLALAAAERPTRAQVDATPAASSAPPTTAATPATQNAAAPVEASLLARAASSDPRVRLGAVPDLASAGSLASSSLLVVMLQRDGDARVRQAAAMALSASANPEVRPSLQMAATYDPDPWVRAGATYADHTLAPFDRRPKLAAGLSVLCPGCGYFYLHQSARGSAYLSAAIVLLAGGVLVQRSSPTDFAGHHVDGRALPLYMATQNLWFYGIYAAYRDARLGRGDAGYRYPVARDELSELLIAPFNPGVIKSPYVWAGVPLMVGAAVGFSYLVSRVLPGDTFGGTRTLGDPGGVRFFGHEYGTKTGFALGEGYHLSIMLPVAAGEESLFRGVIQAGLSETPLGLWGGWAVGSAIFGGVHVFNFIETSNGFQVAAFAVPYLMVTGSYLGYVFIKKDFSLVTGAAIHFWYDFALSTIDFIADPDHQPFVARFAMPF